MRRGLAPIGLLALLFAAPAMAQSGRLALEGRGGIAVPVGDLRDEMSAGTGFSAALDLMYSFSPLFTAFLGGNRDEFDGGFSSTGLQGGVRIMPMRDVRALPWVSAAVTGQELSANGFDYSFGIGFEGGAGLDVAVSERFSLAPSVRYRTYEADLDRHEIGVRSVTIALGAHWTFR
jgi:hypothetical protein